MYISLLSIPNFLNIYSQHLDLSTSVFSASIYFYISLPSIPIFLHLFSASLFLYISLRNIPNFLHLLSLHSYFYIFFLSIPNFLHLYSQLPHLSTSIISVSLSLYISTLSIPAFLHPYLPARIIPVSTCPYAFSATVGYSSGRSGCRLEGSLLFLDNTFTSLFSASLSF